MIPPSVTPTRSTPTFTCSSVPPGLLAAHRTSVWAELVVTAGEVVFVEEQPLLRKVVGAGHSVVIVPGRLHHVEPVSGAEFHVQFYSAEE